MGKFSFLFAQRYVGVALKAVKSQPCTPQSSQRKKYEFENNGYMSMKTCNNENY